MPSIYDNMDPEQRRNATLRGAAAFGDAPAVMADPNTTPVSGGGLRIGNAASMAQGMLPMTMQAMDNNRANFDQRVAQGGGGAAVAGRVLGGGLRDAALTAQSFVDDTLVRPSRAIAGTVGPAMASFGRGLMGGAEGPTTPVQPPAQQAAVRRLDNATMPLAPAPAQPAAATPTAQATLAAPSPPVSSQPTDTMGQVGRDIAHQQYLQTVRNANDPTPGMGVIDDLTWRQDASRRFGEDAALNNAMKQGSWSPRGGFKGNDTAVAAALEPVKARAKLREMSLQNEGRQQEARMQSADRRYLGDQASEDRRFAAQESSEARRYAADSTLAGNRLQAGSAAAKLEQDAKQSDRQYGLDVAKLGKDVADKQFTQRETSRKSVEDQVAGMVPPGADGKPDAAGVARHMSVLNNAVAQRQTQLEAQVARGGPNARAAGEELKAIQEKGFGAMDQASIRKLIVGTQLNQTIQQTGTSSWNPIGTDAANTRAPVSSLRADPGLFGTDYIATHADGATSNIPGRNLRQNGRWNEDLNLLLKR